MTSKPIIPGRAYDVDGVIILSDHPASAAIEYIRIMAAHQVKLAIGLHLTRQPYDRSGGLAA